MDITKHNIILFASNGNNIGKTTTAKNFILDLFDDYNLPISKHSFAEPIRDISKQYLNLLFPYFDHMLFNKIYNQENKNKPLIEFIPEYRFDYLSEKFKTYSVRDIVNLFSDKIQELTEGPIWANFAYQHILENCQRNNDSDKNRIVVYDDFRRSLEYTYLKENLDSNLYNIITIYLDKEGNKNQVSTSYEGQLIDFSFDITFIFKEDYSNESELFSMIKQKLH